MKRLLVLGAGHSAGFAIARLLERASRQDWVVTVGDLDADRARSTVGDHPCGTALGLDSSDSHARGAAIGNADIVINLLPPRLQVPVAQDCVALGCHMVSASYRPPEIEALDAEARKRGLLILSEMGLDPGIDHMSAVALIARLRRDGGSITSFRSYGAGLPAPAPDLNPLRYVITWNPRNVAMAGAAGARFLRDGVEVDIGHTQVFEQTWPVEVDGVGSFEAYANRDSLPYIDSFALPAARTMIRGTLRYPGFAAVWSAIIRLGLADEQRRIEGLADRTYAEVTTMGLPPSSEPPRERVRRALGLGEPVLDKLEWLGLLSRDFTGCTGQSSAEMLVGLLPDRLPLGPAQRDMVILQHDLEVTSADDMIERVTSTMVAYGEPGGFTAMARTVGLPIAIGVELLHQGTLAPRGCCIPTDPAIGAPVLEELARAGIRFVERTTASNK